MSARTFSKNSFSHFRAVLIVLFASALVLSIVLAPTAFAATNLVANPSLETPTSGDPSLPDQWFKGYDDASSVITYSYPVTDAPTSAISSGNAAKIVMTGTSANDAKWYFKPVVVSPGQTYTFSDSYIATVPTDYVAAFCTDVYLNGCTYAFASVSVTPANTWTHGEANFTVPSGKTYMTVFHRIASAGTLITDTYSLSPVTPPAGFATGFVSLTFDDGFASQYLQALPLLTAKSLRGTFYVVTHLVPGISLQNGSFESSTGATPDKWQHTGAASFVYPAANPHGGAGAAEVTASTTSTNAGWYFDSVTVLPDSIYTYTVWYRSSTAANLVARVTLTDGSQVNADFLGDPAGSTDLGSSLALASTNGAWQQAKVYFYVPENGKSVTVQNRLTGAGTLAIDDATLGVDGYMTKDQVVALQSAGQEVGSHTQTHRDLTTLSSSDLANEIGGASADLTSAGINTVSSIAYPYGANNAAVQDSAKNSGLIAARSIATGWNDINASKYNLLSQSVNADTTVAQVQSWIDQAKHDHTWLILTFHQIDPNVSQLPFGATPATLSSIVSYLAAGDTGIPVKTVTEGVAMLDGSTPPPPTTHTITASAGANGSISPSGTVTVTDGSDVSFAITPASGYVVSSVLVDGTNIATTTSYTFKSNTANHTISASFAPVSVASKHAITASAGANGSISPSGAVSVTDGTDTTFTITPASGYSINKLTIDGTAVTATSTYTFKANSANHTINATFVKIKDTVAPVITLIGANPLTIKVRTTFTDPGATVTDNVDATRTIKGTGLVLTSFPGTYTLTYRATDAAGNSATTVTRKVTVTR